MNLKLARIILEQNGYLVTEATDAEEAMDILKYRDFDLILMDIQLPKMDGLTLTSIIKEDPEKAHIPIIALTAHAMVGDRDKALKAGCVGYISKPIDTEIFPKRVQQYIEESKK